MAALPKEFEDSLKAMTEGHDLSFLRELQAPETIHVNADAKSLHKILKMVQAINEASSKSGMQKWFDPDGEFPISSLPKHEAFFAAGAIYPERLFMAANRVGKSVCGCSEDAYHATGDYPTWWTGKRFDHPVDIWVVGPDAVTVRDTVQKELLGALGEEGTGMLPASCLGKATGKQGVVGAVDKIRIRHITGGWSTISFKNYKQDIQAFMGASVHVVHLDEEAPIEIWNECNIRTATTEGIMYATFTPLNGYSRMVVNFCKSADFLMGAKPLVAADFNDLEMEDGIELVGSYKKKAVIQAGWDDAPWLTKEIKERLLADTPEHLKEARSKGIPSMEGGSVFTTPLESVLVEPFVIPDEWPRMYGLDVGWNVTAAVWAALDPNTGIVYAYDEHYQGEQMPQHHSHAIKMRGEWIRGVIDPASGGRSQRDGTMLMKSYKELGLRLLPADNSLEAGLHKMNELFSTGRLKIFKTMRNIQKEYMLYKRKLNGAIDPHCDDHALDCFDAETEVLTKDGWKLWEYVTYEDELASVDLSTDTLVYDKPQELIRNWHDGPMIYLDNKAQQMVTPNHRVVVYPRSGGYAEPVVKLAKDLSIWDKIKLGVSNWEGEEYTSPVKDIEPELFAEVLGWWIAEGSLNHPYECNPYRKGVVISQMKDEGVESLHRLLKDMPRKWNYIGNSFQCTHKELYDYLKQFGLSGDKFVPQDIKQAPKHIISAFLRGYFGGDGWVYKNGTAASASISKQLTDDIQEMMFKVGRPGNVLKRKAVGWSIDGRSGKSRDQWWFIEHKVKTAMLRDFKNTPNFGEVEYTGWVYCATVPHGTLVVRRSGKVSVSGNCLRYVINNMQRMSSRTESVANSRIHYAPVRYDI